MGRSRGVLHNVPELPIIHLPRDEDLNHVKTLLLAGSVAISAPSIKVGVQGMGGIGKSVLAAAVARDPKVREAFPDGIVWVSIGQTPALVSLQFDVMTALGVNPQPFDNPSQGTTRLREALRDKRCLLILDDVWKPPDAFAFNALGPQGRMLVTTRKLSTISTLTQHQHEVKVLSEAQALQLLGQWFDQTDFEQIPLDTRKALVKECGCLPLAVALVGALLKRRPGREGNILKKLKDADLAAIKEQFPDYPYPDLLKALQVSVDDLPSTLREQYLDFVVFPEDVQIPEQVLYTFWQSAGLDEDNCEDVIDELANRSLLIRNHKESKLSLHDLQRDYIRTTCGNLAERHQALLRAYTAKCPDGWASGPNDGYFFEHLAGHLIQAGKATELFSLLFDYKWLSAKLNHTDPLALIRDYDVYLQANRSDDKLQAEKLVRDALQLSAHILNRDKGQLRSQLWGRLVGFTSFDIIQGLLNQAKESSKEMWLRPTTNSLAPLGGSLLFTLEGHHGRINAVAVSPDGKRMVSGAEDGTLQIWDLDKRDVLVTLTENTGVTAVALLKNGQQLVSAHTDGTLTIWDVEQRKRINTLSIYKKKITSLVVIETGELLAASDAAGLIRIDVDRNIHCQYKAECLFESLFGDSPFGSNDLAVSSDGSHVAFLSSNGILEVWNIKTKDHYTINTGKEVGDLYAVTILSDNRRVVTGGCYSTLAVWDFKEKKLEWKGRGTQEAYGIYAVASISATSIVSGSEDGAITIWDINTKEPRVLGRHSFAVTALTLFNHDQRVMSASFDGTIKIWDATAPETEKISNRHSDWVRSIIVSADGKNLLSASEDETLKIWDVPTGQIKRIYQGHGSGVCAIVRLKDRKTIISGSTDGMIKIWNLETGEDKGPPLYHPGELRSLNLTDNEVRLVSTSRDGVIKIWDLESKKEDRSLQAHYSDIPSLPIRIPDRTPKREVTHSHAYNTYNNVNDSLIWKEKFLVLATNCSLRLWDIEDNKEAKILGSHESEIFSISELGDKSHIVSASKDGTLKMWDIDSGTEFAIFEGHRELVSDVAAFGGGTRIISASYDRTVKLWDVEKKTLLFTFEGEDPFTACAVDPDGKMVFAGDKLGRIHLLKLEEP